MTNYGPPKRLPGKDDAMAIKTMLAEANVHYFVRSDKTRQVIIATGTWGETAKQQSQHGIVEFVFTAEGMLLSLEGVNEQIPPMGFFRRIWWVIGGSRGHR